VSTPTLVLAIDIGTSSARSALFDLRGRRHLATTAQASYQLRTGADGQAELDPAELLEAVSSRIGETLAAQRLDPVLRRQAIAGVGVSCFWHSLIGTDATGAPLTPVITWADSRCRDDAERLRTELDERAVHARTGCMLRASFWPAKLRWLTRTRPGLFKRVARWMAPTDWIFQQLCAIPPAQLHCAHGMATGTGLYDPGRRDWDARMLATCGLRREQLLPIDDAPLRLTADGPPRGLDGGHGQLRGTRWFPAIGDGAASNLGSGATRPGLAAINFGTSGAVRIMCEDRPVSGVRRPSKAPFGLFRYRVDERRYLIGGAISNAGNLRAWCLRELRLPDEPEAIERALAQRRGPDHGLAVLPFWSAERAPTWREDVSGAVVGLTQATTALDLLQAITEATYHRLATIVERIPRAGRAPRFIVGGGVQKSPASLQRLADVLGHPLTALDEPEASLRGAAVLALERLGHARGIAAVTGRSVRPQAAVARRYAAERARLAALEATLFPLASPRRKADTGRIP
jgi:gluconokinase